MARPSAPSMPTERQIQDAAKVVGSIHPGARIARVGPEGVSFAYPEDGITSFGTNRVDQLIEARRGKS